MRSAYIVLRCDDAACPANGARLDGQPSRFCSGATPTLTELLDPRGYRKLYATEAATRLYVEFVIRYQCEDISGQGRPDATLELRGDGSYDTATGNYHDVRSLGEKLAYIDAEGQQKIENTIIAVASSHLGHRTINHTVRTPLD